MAQATYPKPGGSLFRRGWRWLSTPVRYLWREFYYAPRLLQWAIILILFAGGIIGAVSGYRFYARRSVAMASASAWTAYQAALLKGDLDAMKAALDRAVIANPNDTLAARKRQNLEMEEADPDDTELAIILMNHHMKGNRLHEMYREASKVRLRFPKDWRAICAQAHYDLLSQGVSAALARLEELPNPEDPVARIDVGGLLYSLQLFESTGQDASSLRGLIVRRLLPILRGGAANTASPFFKVSLVECYLEPFHNPDNIEVLANYWADASKLVDLALESAVEEQDVPLLIRIGKLGPKMLGALDSIRMRQAASPHDERFVLLRKQITDRTRQAWTSVLDKEPGRVEAHLGLIHLAQAVGDLKGVVEGINSGLTACGDRTELLLSFAEIGLRLQQVEPVIQRVWAAAKKEPNDIGKWLLAAKVAKALKEPRLAYEALEHARKLDANHPEAALMMVDWYLEQGQPASALEILGGSIFSSAQWREPAVIFRKAQALTAMRALPFDYLDELLQAVGPEKRSVPLMLAGLQGIFAAQPARPEVDVRIARLAEELVVKDPNGPQASAARLLAARSWERQSEYVNPPWPRQSCAAALRNYDQLPADIKLSTPVALARARLQLKGLKDPHQAAVSLGKLLDSWHTESLQPADLEIIGLTLLEKGRREEALKVLEHAVKLPGASPGCWIALARARHALGRRDAAREALDYPNSKFLTFTPREYAEWTETSRILQQELP